MSTDDARFEAMFRSQSPRVFAYALRHTDPASAHDVVSEVFLVAWRRIADLPAEPLPWLLVTARNTLSNQRRSLGRRTKLVDRVAALDRVAAAAPAAEDAAVDRAAMLDALAELSVREREALLLVAWDGLNATQAAEVAGCSRRAFEVRLSRARARLRRLIEPDSLSIFTMPEEASL